MSKLSIELEFYFSDETESTVDINDLEATREYADGAQQIPATMTQGHGMDADDFGKITREF